MKTLGVCLLVGLLAACGEGNDAPRDAAQTEQSTSDPVQTEASKSDPARTTESPGDLVVLRSEAVDAAGGSLVVDDVTVTVPAGALSETATVSVTEPLGEFGIELGGHVVRIEHVNPVQNSVRVTWDVSHLSDVQQRSLLVVRWNEEASTWVPADADYGIVDGTLTTETQVWSWLSWNTLANGAQTLGEILGIRVDAPKCAVGELPNWVTSALEPDEGTNAASIRLCYENGPGENVTMRIANNRNYSRFVYTDSDDGWAAVRHTPPEVSALEVAQLATSAALSNNERVFLPPLGTVAVDIAPPPTVLSETVTFSSERPAGGYIADVLFFAAAFVPTPTVVTDSQAYVEAFIETLFECGSERVTNPSPSFSEAAGAVAGCASDFFADPESAVSRASEAKLQSLIPANDTVSSGLSVAENTKKFRSAALKLKKYLAYAALIDITTDLTAYLADLALDAAVRPPDWSITGQGSPRDLGDWTPTCSNIDEDSNRLYKNLVLREPFTGKASLPDLHKLNTWDPSAEKAVAPLTKCDNNHNVAVAVDVTSWGLDAADKRIVSDLILALVYPDITDGPNVRFTAITAGGDHSCGLRTDGFVQCWGGNDYGESDAPLGKFTAISAGSSHTCALRTNGFIQCWGDNRFGETEAPDGAFTVVTAGSHYSCGLTSDGTTECWGSDSSGRLNAPTGVFTAIDASLEHSCGLRPSGAIKCWGSSRDGKLNAPTGVFTAIAAGDYHSCGIRSVGSTECWGDNGQTNVPVALFTDVTAGSHHSCGLRSDGAVQCWGTNLSGRSEAPAGLFTAITAGSSHTCGLRSDGTAECWGDNDKGQSTAPNDPTSDTANDPHLTAITAAVEHACGLRNDGTAECWGNDGGGKVLAPDGVFSAISVGTWRVCGLRNDGTAECWRSYGGGKVFAPDGVFTAISEGTWGGCGLRNDGTAECWGGSGYGGGKVLALDGVFSAISVGTWEVCGLRNDGTAECWDNDDVRKVFAPDGVFTAITVGSRYSCGLRSDGTAECWGRAFAPDGVFSAISVGSRQVCGLRSDGTAECWRSYGGGKVFAPDGAFTAISVGPSTGCGDGTTSCWG